MLRGLHRNDNGRPVERTEPQRCVAQFTFGPFWVCRHRFDYPWLVASSNAHRPYAIHLTVCSESFACQSELQMADTAHQYLERLGNRFCVRRSSQPSVQERPCTDHESLSQSLHLGFLCSTSSSSPKTATFIIQDVPGAPVGCRQVLTGGRGCTRERCCKLAYAWCRHRDAM